MERLCSQAYSAVRPQPVPDASRKGAPGRRGTHAGYDFEHAAICEAYSTPERGAVFASGPLEFAESQLTLAVTGETSDVPGSNAGSSIFVAARHGAQRDATGHVDDEESGGVGVITVAP